ncbi:MAG: hydrolase [Bacteroidetes bacterium]|jgi:hypothetical protein|nr:hydrolase [Bacteroidota bacterium]
MREKAGNKFGKYQCPCCGYYTLEHIHHRQEICEVCYWQDEYYTDPDIPDGGPNKESLNEARANFIKYGACNELSVGAVRIPLPEEMPDEG